MIRFALLQFRTQAAVVFGLLVAVGIVLVTTEPQLMHLYDTTVRPCAADGNCATATANFVSNNSLLQSALGDLMIVVPALIGMFWGAPLVARELETNTFLLIWTQSVTRERWLTVKLGVVGLASIAVAALLSLLVTWWFSPIDSVNMNRFVQGVFDERAIVPIGYAAFAFILGVTLGALIRRTLPAMAATLAGFIAARLVVSQLVRPYFQSPLTFLTLGTRGPLPVVAGAVTPPHPSDWVLSHWTHSSCTIGSGASARACSGALRQIGFTYQPAARYWPFQWYETAIFVGLALLTAAFCFWWVRRRLA